MKKSVLLLIAVISMHILSCKKNEDNTTSNKVSSPFTVKYEITSSTNVYSNNSYSNTSQTITYVNSTGQQQTETVTNLSDSNPWSKTITVTSGIRPLQLSLLLSSNNQIYLSKTGQITQNIFVNGKLVASSTNQSTTTSTSGGAFYIQIIALNYTIN